MAQQTCTGCRKPRPCPFTLLTADGAHRRCAACHARLIADAQRAGTEIVVMVRPAPVTV